MPSINRTYSFLDVTASVQGPGGGYMISEGGVANGGITIETNDRVTTVWGCDGEFMHSLHAARGGRVTVRCMRTGRANADLSKTFNFDSQSSANTGRNTITIQDHQRGDNWTIEGAAIVKIPTNAYGTEGGEVEWVFQAGIITGWFGTGDPNAIVT